MRLALTIALTPLVFAAWIGAMALVVFAVMNLGYVFLAVCIAGCGAAAWEIVGFGLSRRKMAVRTKEVFKTDLKTASATDGKPL